VRRGGAEEGERRREEERGESGRRGDEERMELGDERWPEGEERKRARRWRMNRGR